MRNRRISRAFVATCLLAAAHVVMAPHERLREAIGEALIGIAAAISAGATKEKAKERGS